MVKNLASISWQQFYSTGQNDLASDFYAPAITQSILIERAVGYFRSTAYLLLYEEFYNFLRSGGKLKLICSPKIHREDIRVFTESLLSENYKTNESDSMQELLEEILEIEKTEAGKIHLKLLGGMLHLGLAEFKIAFTNDGNGIFHEKIGILHDDIGQKISFSGSANETLCGWGVKGNIESFDVFCSWKKNDESRVRRHQEIFKETWNNNRTGVYTLDLDKAITKKLLQEAPETEEEFYRTFTVYKQLATPFSSSSLDKTISSKSQCNAWPSGRKAEKHQKEALEFWSENNHQGILKYATGSGKTFIALHAIRNHVRTGKIALIVVPSTLLLESWRDEIRLELPDAVLFLASSKYSDWKNSHRLTAFTSQLINSEQRIILTTIQTASEKSFYLRLNRSEEIFLVVDEVHQLGSTKFSSLMNCNFGKRLGLSATPERYGDPEGTAKILNYFKGIIGNEFTLSDAMSAGRLVPYYYYPTIVSLDENESKQWEELTRKINRTSIILNNSSLANNSNQTYLKILLTQRSRIAKKAAEKILATTRILHEHYKEGQHWLIYCEDQNQMTLLSESLQNINLKPLVYHSAMKGDSQRTLHHFINNGGVMVSIRCLDEGIDIPEISHAVIVASSQNPRQFIQRRGRVLRKAKNKNMAYIWDILVLPLDDSENRKNQDSLTRSEMTRAIEFANTAINQADASQLRLKAMSAGVDLEMVYPQREEDG